MKSRTCFKVARASGGLSLALAGLAIGLSGIISAILGVGSAVFLAACAYFAIVGVIRYRRRRPILPRSRQHRFTSRWASSEADVAAVYDFFCDQLEDRSEVSMEMMRSLHLRNPQTLRLVERSSGAETRLVGIVILVPLTSEAADLARRTVIRDPFDANIAIHAAPTWEVNAAYIGGIAGLGVSGRAVALTFCETWLSQHSIIEAFARPVSDDGERALRRWGFRSIGKPSLFWMLNYSGPSQLRARRALEAY